MDEYDFFVQMCGHFVDVNSPDSDDFYGDITDEIEYEDIVKSIELKGADEQVMTFLFVNGKLSEWY